MDVLETMGIDLLHLGKRGTKSFDANENLEGCFFLLILTSEMWVYAKKSPPTLRCETFHISTSSQKNSKTLTWKQQNDRLLKFNTTLRKRLSQKYSSNHHLSGCQLLLFWGMWIMMIYDPTNRRVLYQPKLEFYPQMSNKIALSWNHIW